MSMYVICGILAGLGLGLAIWFVAVIITVLIYEKRSWK